MCGGGGGLAGSQHIVKLPVQVKVPKFFQPISGPKLTVTISWC